MEILHKTCRKGLKQKSEHLHRTLHIQNSLVPKFQLQLTILNFWTKLTKKGYFRSKREKNNENHHQIPHIQISLGFKFQLQQPILIFLKQIFQIMILLVENRRNEHHY